MATLLPNRGYTQGLRNLCYAIKRKPLTRKPRLCTASPHKLDLGNILPMSFKRVPTDRRSLGSVRVPSRDCALGHAEIRNPPCGVSTKTYQELHGLVLESDFKSRCSFVSVLERVPATYPLCTDRPSGRMEPRRSRTHAGAARIASEDPRPVNNPPGPAKSPQKTSGRHPTVTHTGTHTGFIPCLESPKSREANKGLGQSTSGVHFEYRQFRRSNPHS